MSDVEKNIGTHKPEFAGEWVPFDRAFAEVSRGVKKFGQNEYLDQGEHPIIDQGKNAIAGYSNEQLGMFKDVPTIVFGDHTRIFKYVDRPFFIGADGVKILKPLLSENVLFWYYALCAANIENLGYSRHFKLLKEKSFLNSSHEDQASITQILETVDEQISLSNSLLSALDDLVKSQFMEIFSECLGDKVSLSDVVWFQEGPGVRNYQYTAHGVKLLNVANLHDGELDISNTGRYISEEEAYGRYRHFLVEEGDLIIASSGIKVDYFDQKMGFAKKEQLPLCMNTSTIRFQAIDSRLNMIFFMYYLKSDDFKQQLARQITGSAQLNFGPSHLKKMSVPMPPFALQQQFADFVAQVDKLGFDVQQQIEKLETLKRSLMQEYFG